MFLMDVNVLVYAHREDTADHFTCREWLESIINGSATFDYAEFVLSSFLLVVAHPRVFEMPSVLSDAIDFANQIRHALHTVFIAPRGMNWEIFTPQPFAVVVSSKDSNGPLSNDEGAQ